MINMRHDIVEISLIVVKTITVLFFIICLVNDGSLNVNILVLFAPKQIHTF